MACCACGGWKFRNCLTKLRLKPARKIVHGLSDFRDEQDEAINGECCGGMNNPRSSEHMIWFYARRHGLWYYIEIGKYE